MEHRERHAVRVARKELINVAARGAAAKYLEHEHLIPRLPRGATVKGVFLECRVRIIDDNKAAP